jgi:ACT domain-containing protein
MAIRPADKPDKTKKEIIKALFECYGIVTAACKKVGIARDTYYQWYRNDPEFAKACDATEISTIGMVEDKLYGKILSDDTTSIIFYLKTKGKHKGYVERIEQTGANGGAIQSEVTIAASKTDLDILEEYKNKLTGAQ